MLTFPGLDSPQQRLRLTRLLEAMAAAVFYTMVCALLFLQGMFRIDAGAFLGLLVALWVINLGFPALVLSGLNQRLRDPSMTMALILWSTVALMVGVYLLDEMRPALLLVYPMVLLFGAFRLNLVQFLIIGMFGVVAYLVVILLLLQWHPDVIDPAREFTVLVAFAFVTLGMALLGNEVSRLRERLHQRNRELNEAVERIEKLAITDHLTGMFNRRFISGVLRRQKGLADRGDYRFAVAFVDLDHFKEVNDDHGHAAGDEVLKRLAEIIREEMREPDYAARYGGEEFLLVMPLSDRSRAWHLVERLRERIAAADMNDIVAGLKITVSAGIADHRPGESVETLLERADQRLYQAKETGRNRIVYSDDAAAAGEDA